MCVGLCWGNVGEFRDRDYGDNIKIMYGLYRDYRVVLGKYWDRGKEKWKLL